MASQSLQFRSLNLPVPIDVVENGAERPTSITLPPARSGAKPLGRSRQVTRSRQQAQEDRSLAVTSINDLWQVDDEWWREHPISRRYYQVTTQNPVTQREGRLTIFRDQINGTWHWQKGG